MIGLILLLMSGSVTAFPRILPFRQGNNYFNCISYDGRNCDVYLGFPPNNLQQNDFRNAPQFNLFEGDIRRSYPRINPQDVQVDVEKGNSVTVAMFIEAQCPDTTRFVHQQLFPSWQKLGSLSRITWVLVPFGKAQCTATGDGDFRCQCQHGSEECALNSLMNCAITQWNSPDRYIPLVNCIQGRGSLLDARRQCLDVQDSSDVARLMECASGAEGRRLLARAGRYQQQMAPGMNFVPWVNIDGTRSVDGMYDLTYNLCKSLVPTPLQCNIV